MFDQMDWKKAGLRICASAAFVALTGLNATAQETVLTERSLNKRVANWHFANISEETLNTKTAELDARIVDLEVVATGPMRFSATLIANKGAHQAAWHWRYDMTKRGLKQFAEANNYRITDLEVYRTGGRVRFAAVFRPNSNPSIQWSWRFGTSAQTLWQEAQDQDMRIIDIERYRDNGEKFAAVMVGNSGSLNTEWGLYYGVGFSELLDRIRDSGMRPLDIERYGDRFAVVLVPPTKDVRTWHLYNVSGKDLTAMVRRHGARVIDLEKTDQNRFDALLLDNGMSQKGHCKGRLRHFGVAMRALMKKHAIPGGQIAVTKDDRLVYSCAFGLAEINPLVHTTPDHLFRIMSVSKLITLSAIRQLAGENRFDLDDKMIDVLGNRAPAQPYRDPSMNDITIEHLMNMQSGLVNGDIGYGPMVDQASTAAAMGQDTPLSCRKIANFAIRTYQLSHPPGSPGNYDRDQRYSNLSYCMLQLIVAEASGKNYQRYVRDEILAPAGITRMIVGRGRQSRRAEGEVAYYNLPFAAAVASPYPGDTEAVPKPYSYVVEAMAGHGGWIATANDLVRYGVFTPTRPNGSGATVFFGSINGTRSVLKQSGDVHVAIVWNASPNGEFDLSEAFGGLIDDAIAQVTRWPARTLWAEYGYPD